MFSRRRDGKGEPPTAPGADDPGRSRLPRTSDSRMDQPTQDRTMANTSTDRPATSFRPEIPRRTPDLPVARAPGAMAQQPAPPAAPEVDPEEELKRLTVGKGIVLNGQISACDKLVVEGKVEATLSQTRAVEIAESGMLKGSAEIDEADVSGRFEGQLVIRGRLSIRSTGRVQGEIRYGQLEIEAGGQLVGDIQVFEESAQAAANRAEKREATVVEPARKAEMA